jgi:hypothetical protein
MPFFTVIGVYPDNDYQRYAETVEAPTAFAAEYATTLENPSLVVAAVVAGTPEILDVEYHGKEQT